MQQIFGATGHINWWQEADRAILVFAFGLLLVRAAGRRIFGKWAALDIVVSILVGSNLSRAVTGSAPLAGTLIASALIMLLHWLLSHLGARWPALAHMLEGVPITLARAGKADRSTILHHAISKNDLDEALRQSSVEDVADTRLLTLEPSGKITVLKSR